MRTYLVRIPRRQGHSTHSDVLTASPIADESRRIQGPTRVGPHGRDLKLPHGNSDRTTGPKLGSSFLLSVLSRSTAPAGRLQYLGPGRRIGLCCEATRAPSQGPTPNGAARCRPLPFGIGTQALNRVACAAPRRSRPPSYVHPCFSLSFAPASASARHSA